MKLTREEFSRLRPELGWGLREVAGHVYNTPQTKNDTRLFWLDFLRTVFAPKFAAQRGVVRIPSFDVTQPVLLTDDLELWLPEQLETAVYYAENQHAPSVRFVALKGIPQLTILSVALVLLAISAFVGLMAPRPMQKYLVSRNL